MEQTSDFVCNRCGYESSTKGNLVRHLISITPCSPLVQDICRSIQHNKLTTVVRPDVTFKCNLCNSVYNHASSLSKHKKTCKLTTNIDENEASTSLQVTNEDEKQQYINQISALTIELQQKSNTIDNLKLEIAFLKNKKNEQFYQEIMEKHFNAAHKTLNIGITDITTDDAHYEIKRWSCWKEALAQLQLYNDEDPKEHIYACFFETCTENHKEKVQNSLNKYNIECLEFHQDESGINLYNLKNKTIVFTYKVEQSDT